jgi:ribonuclease VapC
VIVVDTSALLAILKNEPEADACQQQLELDDTILIAAGTLTEASIVALQRNLLSPLNQLLDKAAIQCVPLSEADARATAAAYALWGKGVHPAGLNFGDCFAYALAKSNNCPLLFVGNDFSQTDIVSAI